ncbi:MAG: hypothetical protein Q8T08_20550 [Ignavibacteria bacterium]|nr:hypothetical protein [Ignavibacteria bacterium]
MPNIKSILNRDFNRTLPQIGVTVNNDEKREKGEELLEGIINEGLQIKFENQEAFDCWHKEKCYQILRLFNNDLNYKEFYYGHAQKWINMSFKYCLAIGECVFPGILQIINYLHVPIDNVIQDRLQKEYKINRIAGPWSKIKDYDIYIYISYQKEIRNRLNGKIPIIVEFELFNE